MSTREIVLETFYPKELKKGWNATILGESDDAHFTNWCETKEEAEEKLAELVGQEGKLVRVEFEPKKVGNKTYNNWTDFEVLGGEAPIIKKNKTGDSSKDRVKQMSGCLEDAEKAYRDVLVAQKSLTDVDHRNIRAIAACFFIEENRR